MTSEALPWGSPGGPSVSKPAAFVRSIPARPADRALAALGGACFKFFLAAQFLSLTRLYFSSHFGGGVAVVASQAGLLSVALLGPAVLIAGLSAGDPFGRLVPGARLWVVTVTALATALFFYGWLEKGYAVSAAAHDFAPYLVIVSAVVLGSLPRVWNDSDRLIVSLFFVALIVNALGMREITNVVSESYSEDRAGVGIVAYRTQEALAFWPFLFLTSRLRRVRVALVIFLGVFFVLAQQILFQKRAPTLRVALFVLVFLVVLPRVCDAEEGSARGRASRLFLATGGLALAAALTLAPWLFEGQFAGLARRLSGEAYSKGAAGMLTTQNERFFEAGVFLRTLRPEEWVVGRGFGGYFKPDASWWGIWLDDVGEFGRRQLHVGGLMPFFKGGLVLALVYYPGLLLALVRGARARREPVAAAAFFVLLIHAVFLLQESWFVMSESFQLVMVGLCMGHLLSRDRAGSGSPRDPLPRSVPA
jgi:hypothetical protein